MTSVRGFPPSNGPLTASLPPLSFSLPPPSLFNLTHEGPWSPKGLGGTPRASTALQWSPPALHGPWWPLSMSLLVPFSFPSPLSLFSSLVLSHFHVGSDLVQSSTGAYQLVLPTGQHGVQFQVDKPSFQALQIHIRQTWLDIYFFIFLGFLFR